MIFHQDPLTRLRLVKGPDERSLNYELISKTQHLKKKNQLIIYNVKMCHKDSTLSFHALHLSRKANNYTRPRTPGDQTNKDDGRAYSNIEVAYQNKSPLETVDTSVYSCINDTQTAGEGK